MSPCSQRGRHWKSFERAKWRAWSIWRISLDLLRELWEFLFIFADFWLFLVIWLKLPWWFSILPGTTGMIYSFCQVKPPSCFMWRPGIYSGSIHIPWPGPKDQTDEVNIDQRSRVFGTKVWLSLWPSKYLTLYPTVSTVSEFETMISMMKNESEWQIFCAGLGSLLPILLLDIMDWRIWPCFRCLPLSIFCDQLIASKWPQHQRSGQCSQLGLRLESHLKQVGDG